jgi:hypothetical protein
MCVQDGCYGLDVMETGMARIKSCVLCKVVYSHV